MSASNPIPAAAYPPTSRKLNELRFHRTVGNETIGQRLMGIDSVKTGDWLVTTSAREVGDAIYAYRIINKTEKRLTIEKRCYDSAYGTNMLQRLQLTVKLFNNWGDLSKTTKYYRAENKSKHEAFYNFMTQEQLEAYFVHPGGWCD